MGVPLHAIAMFLATLVGIRHRSMHLISDVGRALRLVAGTPTNTAASLYNSGGTLNGMAAQWVLAADLWELEHNRNFVLQYDNAV